MPRLAHLLSALTTLSLVVAACSSSSDQAKKKADAGGSGGQSSTPDASGTGPLVCAGSECQPVPDQLAGYGVSSCCTATDQCGLQTPITDGCLEPNEPGGADSTCPGYLVPTGVMLPGCCTPAGTCGAFDATMGLGCIPDEKLGQPAPPCKYDPSNNCATITPLPCDGPEDCPGSQQCCGHYDGGSYTEFGCYDSCDTAGGDAGGSWFALCHEDAQCTPGTPCLTSTYLPSSLARCYTTGAAPAPNTATAAGELNCGSTVCSAGQKCCITTPNEPFCVAADLGCTCRPPSAATSDAGTDAAMPDAGTTSTDGGVSAPADSGAG